MSIMAECYAANVELIYGGVKIYIKIKVLKINVLHGNWKIIELRYKKLM